MYKRYQGNSGKVTWVKENHDRPAQQEQKRVPPPQPPPPPKPSSKLQLPRFLSGGLGELISGSLGDLETEDIILLLILYLMYRESGDSELLIIMGAMFLL